MEETLIRANGENTRLLLCIDRKGAHLDRNSLGWIFLKHLFQQKMRGSESGFLPRQDQAHKEFLTKNQEHQVSKEFSRLITSFRFGKNSLMKGTLFFRLINSRNNNRSICFLALLALETIEQPYLLTIRIIK